MKRPYQKPLLRATFLIALTFVFPDAALSSSALGQAQRLGGALADVPDVPPPTYDKEATERAWDISHPGWRQWRNQPAQADRAEILALKKKQEEQKRLLEEARKKKQQEEQRRRELEQYWNQVLSRKRQQEAEHQRAFEQSKQALLLNFKVPPISVAEASAPISVPESTVAWPTCGQAPFGRVRAAQNKFETGLSSQEWRQARQYHGLIKTLRQSANRSAEDEAVLGHIEARRNSLWAKAVSVPELPDDSREALALTLPVESSGPVPGITEKDIKSVESAADAARKACDDVVPRLLDCIEGLTQTSDGGLSPLGDKSRQFGVFNSIAKIAVTAKREGVSSAAAESLDFIVGKIPMPRATLAVDGGRLYANAAFQAANRFMTDAMRAVGGTFDADAFWRDFKNDLNLWQRTVMEFVHYGTKN